MAKLKTQYICSNCGSSSPKWIGKCPTCNQWNTYQEEVVSTEVLRSSNIANSASLLSNIKAQKISEIEVVDVHRIDTGNNEFNRVLGGGIVPGSVILIGGEPGIGKSTLSLQTAMRINKKTLYVSGEESASQIKLRAERLGNSNDNCLVLCEITVENIIAGIRKFEPDLVIIDSIQTLRTESVESSPGTVTQIRETTNILIRHAKENNVPIIVIGHINKDGNIAGPKILEHMVDAVLQFEGDSSHIYRVLRGIKNRFGTTSEVGIFEMRQNGLEEVSNPSQMLIHNHEENTSGVGVSAIVEGIRPFMIEVQSLVATAAYGVPQRTTTGFDGKRLNMLLAVLERRAGFRLNTKDVFLNVAGGIKVQDPAMDLSVICAVLSSDIDMPIPQGVCFAGEIGLTGEIRPVSRVEQRIAEAEKLGFKVIYISNKHEGKIIAPKNKIQIRAKAKIEEVFKELFVRR